MPQALLIALISLAVPAPALGEILLTSLRVARLPEPGSLILLGTGLIAVAFWLGWSRRRHARRHGAHDQSHQPAGGAASTSADRPAAPARAFRSPAGCADGWSGLRGGLDASTASAVVA